MDNITGQGTNQPMIHMYIVTFRNVGLLTVEGVSSNIFYNMKNTLVLKISHQKGTYTVRFHIYG